MTSTTNDQNPFLKTATQVATITLAVLAVLTTFGAVLVFVIHSVIATDVAPRLDRLEVAVNDLGGRMEKIETRMDSVEQGQQKIIELLTAGKR